MDINASLQVLLTDFLLFLPRLVTALVTFFAALLLSSAAAKSVERYFKHRSETIKAVVLLTQSIRIGVIVFGIILALEQVNFNVTGFVAGLGIAGFTIGFALQDISRNFIAGIILIIRQPFSVGDAIKIDAFSGAVTDITLRDTVIKSWDGERVIIPNATVFNASITNYSDLPLRRRNIIFSINPEQDVARAISIFRQAVENIDGVLPQPQLTIQAEEVNSAGVQIAIRFWTDQSKSNIFEIHSQAIQAIRDAAVREKIGLPSAVQVVQLE
jgi:small conductance mechanosensitive channel